MEINSKVIKRATKEWKKILEANIDPDENKEESGLMIFSIQNQTNPVIKSLNLPLILNTTDTTDVYALKTRDKGNPLCVKVRYGKLNDMRDYPKEVIANANFISRNGFSEFVLPQTIIRPFEPIQVEFGKEEYLERNNFDALLTYDMSLKGKVDVNDLRSLEKLGIPWDKDNNIKNIYFDLLNFLKKEKAKITKSHERDKSLERGVKSIMHVCGWDKKRQISFLDLDNLAF